MSVSLPHFYLCNWNFCLILIIYFSSSFHILYFTEFDSETKRVQDILSGMEKPQVCDAKLPNIQ